jgi:hypothetical protein
MDLADELLCSSPRFPDEPMLGGLIDDIGHGVASAGRAAVSTAKDAVGLTIRAGSQVAAGNPLTAAQTFGKGVASQAKSISGTVISVMTAAIRNAMLPKVRETMFKLMVAAGEAGLESPDLRASVIQTATPVGTAIGTAIGLATPPGGPPTAAVGASIGTASAPILVAASWQVVKAQVRQELAFRKAKAASAANAATAVKESKVPDAFTIIQQRIAALAAAKVIADKAAAAKVIADKAAAAAKVIADKAAAATAVARSNPFKSATTPADPGAYNAARDAAFAAMSPATLSRVTGTPVKSSFNPLLLAIPAVAFLLMKARK